MIALTLDDLGRQLDRSFLHVFVAGPGYGEGIAIALPDRGWVLVDGCETRFGELPLLAIVDRWRLVDDPIEAVLLTHPHTDHAYGIRDLIERTRPTVVGVTTSPTDPALVFRAFEADARARDLGRGRRLVLDGMLALRARYDAAPHSLIALVDGTAIPLTHPAIRATVRSPDAALAIELLSAGIPSNPNELSAAIELTFGATRIVLGSDLPTTAAGRSLQGGWNSVMQRAPELGTHAGLKVPHHGSPEAFHPALMSSSTGRAWWISPFNRGKRLPPTSEDGVPRLVACNGEVSLTATPRPRAQQPVHAPPGVVRLAELETLFTSPNPAAPGALLVTPPDLEPLDPVWCGAFDDQGVLRGNWRGERAFTVVA